MAHAIVWCYGFPKYKAYQCLDRGSYVVPRYIYNPA